MRGTLVATFLAGLVVGVVVAFAGWHPQALGQQGQRAQQWEYKIRFYPEDFDRFRDKTLNELGADGWDYVGVLLNDPPEKGPGHTMVIFKRPKK
jgi:hypothetical protein